MAAHKSKEFPHQWPNGTWHSVPWIKPGSGLAGAVLGKSDVIRPPGEGAVASTPAPKPAASSTPVAADPVASTPVAAAPPRIDPFFTPDDILSMNSWLTDVGDKRASGESVLTTARSDATFQQGQLKDQAAKATAAAQDDAAARGIFQSSMKDATLFDIEAQRATQQGYLNDRLATATADHDTWVSKYGGVLSDGKKVEKGTAVSQFELDWAGKAKANAQAINDTLPAATAPAPAPAPVPAAPAATTPPIKGVVRPQSTAPAKPAAGSLGSAVTGSAGLGASALKATAAPAKKAFTEVPGVNEHGEAGTWHVYPDRKVFVKRGGGMTP